MDMKDYLKILNDETRSKIEPIISYIESKYPKASFDDNWGAKTKMPTYRYNGNYLAIGCMKRYITLHFSNYSAPKYIKDNYPYCKAHVGCVNFSYTRELPYQIIYKAIDETFKKDLS
ncbi:MAG: DUF1801 domain-containing protein [Clostridia bacterium]|jgi:uncharacterized protein YdhG (YjbR/CyaY superfamily)|nr:DUF1801 domain-containing protein [Clostridia bacterium]